MNYVLGPSPQTRQSSGLSRHSAEVLRKAERHPIIVTRRDGDPLVLMSKREADSQARLLEFAAQLITATLDNSGTLAECMAKTFPWILALSQDDRATCAQGLFDSAGASFSTEQPQLLMNTFTSWKETATAITAGLGSNDLEWFDNEEPKEPT